MAFGRPLRGALRQKRLGGVPAEILDDAQNVVWIGEDFETGRDVDMIVDRLGVLRARRLDDLSDEFAEIEGPPVWRLFASRPVGQGRLAELDRAVERGYQPGRETLRQRVGNCGQPIGDELRRREHVAQVVIDSRHRHAELRQTLALCELVGKRPLHRRERGLRATDLVVTPAGTITRDMSWGLSPKAMMLEVSRRTGRRTICQSAAQSTQVTTAAIMQGDVQKGARNAP